MPRRVRCKSLASSPVLSIIMHVKSLVTTAARYPLTPPMPVLLIGRSATPPGVCHAAHTGGAHEHESARRVQQR